MSNVQEPFGVDEPVPLPTGPAGASDSERLLGGLCYVSQFIVPILLPAILLVTDEAKRSPFLRHHAVQSLGLLAASVVYEVAVSLAALFISFSAGCRGCLVGVLWFVPVLPLLYYGALAFQGKSFEIPYVTRFLRSEHWL
jgi:uncharacterized membrane protein